MDREHVENLDSWSIKKGTMVTIKPTRFDTDTSDIGDTFKTQARPLGFTKRNTISLDLLKKIQTSKQRPSLKLAPDQIFGSVNFSPIKAQRLASVNSIAEVSSNKDNDEDNGENNESKIEKSFKKNLPPLGYINEENNEIMLSPKRTVIGDLLMTNSTSKNVEFENKTFVKYQAYLQKLEKKKRKERELVIEKGSTLKEIALLRERLRELQLAGKRSAHSNYNATVTPPVHTPITPNKMQNNPENSNNNALNAVLPPIQEQNVTERKVEPISPTKLLGNISSPLTSKLLEMGLNITRDKMYVLMRQCDEQIVKLREKVENINKKLDTRQNKVNYLKLTVAQCKQELCDHYHKILAQGNDTRQEGLVWIIKAIWNLGMNVNISKLPGFLEEKSVEYLFAFARKEFELEQLRNELRDRQKKEGCDKFNENNDPSIEVREMDKSIGDLRKSLKELREKEYIRIKREFELHSYGLRYNITLESVLVALFGVEFAKQEMEKMNMKL